MTRLGFGGRGLAASGTIWLAAGAFALGGMTVGCGSDKAGMAAPGGAPDMNTVTDGAGDMPAPLGGNSATEVAEDGEDGATNTDEPAGEQVNESPMLAPRDEMSGEEIIDFGVSDEPTKEVEVVCAAQSAASELRQVYLAFALDVSASMGQGVERFNLKWLPIVSAAEAFFSEPDSAAISASLTFFPAENNATWCTDAVYETPNVPQTLLPSDVFTNAISSLNRTPNAAWRTATPTLAVFNGTIASLAAAVEPSPNVTEAVVLVTDGVPQSCSAAANDVALVAEAVRASGVRTFVVGVANPPGLDGGENLDNLNVIAEAGGTEAAFVVETGDPARTEADFKAVIDRIRGVSVSCNIEIPLPPTGTEFIPEKVNVTYTSSEGASNVSLSYDPECTSTDSWRYDDPAAPASIVLCSDTCGTVQRDVRASLNVEFGCERRGVPR